jgi:predicted O-methyltransferase YrrM
MRPVLLRVATPASLPGTPGHREVLTMSWRIRDTPWRLPESAGPVPHRRSSRVVDPLEPHDEGTRPVTLETWTAVDNYFNDLLLPEDTALAEAAWRSDEAGLPAHQVALNQGKLLELLVRIRGARTVLEIGTLGGYSTICLARGLPADGRLITLEANADYARVATENLAKADLSPRVEVRVGDALTTLPSLAEDGLGPFDLVFIDADKPSNPRYLEWALRLTAPGSLIVGDNVVRDGAVADARDEDPRVRGIRKFTEMVAAESRLEATAIQTVGEKGYDGFLLALVTA